MLACVGRRDGDVAWRVQAEREVVCRSRPGVPEQMKKCLLGLCLAFGKDTLVVPFKQAPLVA